MKARSRDEHVEHVCKVSGHVYLSRTRCGNLDLRKTTLFPSINLVQVLDPFFFCQILQKCWTYRQVRCLIDCLSKNSTEACLGVPPTGSCKICNLLFAPAWKKPEYIENIKCLSLVKHDNRVMQNAAQFLLFAPAWKKPRIRYWKHWRPVIGIKYESRC